MTTLRKLTLAISNAVVRYASPGCKDWAEGLAQEAALIEDDWPALRWSLGSTRLLFHRREAPIRSLIEASAIANKFIEKQQDRAARWWLLLLYMFWYLLKFLDAKSSLEHIGCAMVVLASLSLTTSAYSAKRRMSEYINADVEDNDDVLFYKEELQRILEVFPRGLISAFALITGVIMTQRGGAEAHPVNTAFLVTVSLGLAALIVPTRRIIQRRLIQLEALLPARL
jgi:hypothetical protein